MGQRDLLLYCTIQSYRWGRRIRWTQPERHTQTQTWALQGRIAKSCLKPPECLLLAQHPMEMLWSELVVEVQTVVGGCYKLEALDQRLSFNGTGTPKLVLRSP